MMPQSVENTPNLVLDKISDKDVFCYPMKRNPKTAAKDTKITFIASPAEQRIIDAGLEKHGLRKMSDIIRMALRRFAEAEEIRA